MLLKAVQGEISWQGQWAVTPPQQEVLVCKTGPRLAPAMGQGQLGRNLPRKAEDQQAPRQELAGYWLKTLRGSALQRELGEHRLEAEAHLEDCCSDCGRGPAGAKGAQVIGTIGSGSSSAAGCRQLLVSLRSFVFRVLVSVRCCWGWFSRKG